MKRTIPLLVFLLYFLPFGYSQKKERKKDKEEEKTTYETKEKKSNFHLGLNATTVISSFVGNESLIEASDFPLLMRIGANKFHFRLAAGVGTSSTEFFDQIAGIQRINDFNEYFGKGGIELDVFEENKWRMYTGVDAIYSLSIDKITSFSFDQVILKNTVNTIGLGPIIGLKYFLNDRIYLSTEATIYGFMRMTKLTQEENGVIQTLNDATDYSGSIQSPIFLYLNLKL